jgi:hypothetical protein
MEDFQGSGVGSATTLESKYRYRDGQRKCPRCGKEAIIKGRAEFGGGWLCYARKGGCGAKWNDGDAEIEGQQTGKIENQDPADQHNTAEKIAAKRAYVSAVITATASGSLFTSDLEENVNGNGDTVDKPAQPQTKPDAFLEMVKAQGLDEQRLSQLDDYLKERVEAQAADGHKYNMAYWKRAFVKRPDDFKAAFEKWFADRNVPGFDREQPGA